MQMIDTIINTLQDRYADTFKNAGATARCHWFVLLEKLDQINTSIGFQEERDVDITFRVAFPNIPSDGVHATTLRVPPNQDWVVDYGWFLGTGAAALTINENGIPVTVTSVGVGPGRFDAFGLVLFGGSEITASMGGPTASLLLQIKRYMKPANPRPSFAGEQTIGGVDPRENPGAADVGRHSMASTQIGVSDVIR